MIGTLRRALDVIGRERRWRWFGLVLLGLLTSGVEALGSVLVYSLIKMATEDGSLRAPLLGDLQERFPSTDRAVVVAWMGAAMAAFFVLRGLLLSWQVFVQNRMAQRTGVQISRELISGYLAMPYTWHLNRKSSELIRTSYDSVDRVAAYILLPGVVMLSEALVVIALLVVLLVTAPAATGLAVLAMAPVLLLLAKLVRPRLGALGHDTQRLVQGTLQGLQQTFEGFREITLLGKAGEFEQRVARVRSELAAATYKRAALVEVPRYSIETASMLFILFFLSLGIARATPSGESFAVLGLFAYAVLRVMPSVNRSLAYSNLVKFGTAALEQVQDDLHLVRSLPSAAGAVEPRGLTQGIELRSVSFRYPGSAEEVLHDVSLELPAGASIGVVGPTGGGKSTLVDVVLGLLEPTSGEVLVDGADVRDDVAAWHQSVAAVPQLVFLLDDTLRANIAFGVPDGEVDEEALSEAVALAQLTEVVASLPARLDTVIGERGIRLSGGQRQRVAIARALYRRAGLLVLDEGTSALDNLTEAEFVAALERLRGSRTIITIAHRLSTVRSCDTIVVMDQGRVVAQGTYDELKAGSELFRQLAV